MALSSVLTSFKPTNTGAVASPTAAPSSGGFNSLLGSSGALQSSNVNSLLNGEGVGATGKNTDAQILQNVAGAESPLVGEQLNYGAGLEPQRESAINDYINSMGQSGVNAQIASYGNAAQENAGVASRNADLALGGQGAGQGAIAGTTGNLFGNAAQATNNYGAQENSPQAQQQRLAGTLSAIMGGMSSPALQTEEQLYSPLESTAQFNQQNQNYANANSPLGSIGGLVGGGLASAIGSGGFLPNAFTAPAGNTFASGGAGNTALSNIAGFFPGG
jgi:hypothetical protein